MPAHDIALRLVACVAGVGMFIAGMIGTTKQGFWKP
jgi:hypothetical protein